MTISDTEPKPDKSTLPNFLWIKFALSHLDDPDFMQQPDEVVGVYTKAYLLAGKADAGGVLCNGNKIYSLNDIAWLLRADPVGLEKKLKALESIGFISKDGDGYRITRFMEEQGPGLDADRQKWRERQKKHREQIKKVELEKSRKEEDVEVDIDIECHSDIKNCHSDKNPTTTSSSFSSQICKTCNKPIDFYYSDTASDEIVKIIKSEMSKSYPKDEQIIYKLAEKVTMQFESGCFCEVQRLSKIAIHDLFCEKCGGWKNQSNQDVFDLIYESIRVKFPDGDDELAQDTANQMVGDYDPWCPKCDTAEWLKRGLDWYEVLWEGQQKGEYPMASFPDEFGRTEMYSGICRTQ